MRIYLEPGPIDKALSIDTPGVEYILAPGVYTTQGVWAHGNRWDRVLPAGTRMRVDNGQAEIRLANPVLSLDQNPRPERDLWVMTAGPDCFLSDLTFNGCYQDHPEHFVKAGLRWHGHLTGTDLAVVGLRGSYPEEIEAFGFSIFDGCGGCDLTGVSVHNCAPDSYVNCFNLGSVVGDRISSLLNWTAHPGPGNWVGLGVNERVTAKDGKVVGCRNAIYNDTGPTSKVRVRGLQVTDCCKVVSLIRPPGGSGAKGDVLVEDLDAHLTGGVSHLIECWDQNDADPVQVGNVVILGADVTLGPDVKEFYAWALAGKTILPVAIVESKIPAFAGLGPGTYLERLS